MVLLHSGWHTFFYQFQQHTICSFGVEEDSPPFGGEARLLVEDGGTLSLHIGEGSVNVLDFEADMMQAFAAFLQEFGKAGGGIGWLDQLDFSATGTTQRQESDAYLLGRHFFDNTRKNAQCVTIEAQSLLDITHNDGNMINPLGHSTPPRMFELGRARGSPSWAFTSACHPERSEGSALCPARDPSLRSG